MFEVMESTFWSIHKLREETYSQFREEVFWLRIVVICFYLNLVVATILAWIYSWYPQWYFLANISYSQHMCFELLFAAAFAGGYMICYLHVYIPLYFALNIKVQMVILESYFENITHHIKTGSVQDMPINEYNQTIIKNRLLVGIRQHVAYKR